MASLTPSDLAGLVLLAWLVAMLLGELLWPPPGGPPASPVARA